MSQQGVAATQSFYTRWALLYDAIATHMPGVGNLRERAVAELTLEPGDVVVEMGCGTGANFPYLRRAVGPAGTVVGVDFTPGMVGRARRRVEREGWANVHVVRGDAARPPIAAAVDADSGTDAPEDTDDRLRRGPDAVFSSFVSGMLADPASVVNDWCNLVGPGGRVGLLDLGRSTRAVGRPLNALFHGLVFAASPTKRGAWRAAAAALDSRIAAAQGRLRDRCSGATYSTHALGFVRLGVGTVD